MALYREAATANLHLRLVQNESEAGMNRMPMLTKAIRRLAIASACTIALYLLGSGPACTICPAVRHQGDFGAGVHLDGLTRGFATVYAPVIKVRRQHILKEWIDGYWDLVDRNNFYCDEFNSHWAAIRYSRVGNAICRAFGD